MNNLNRKIKLAFILWKLEGMGRSERVVYDIARKINSKNYTIVIISFEDGPIRLMYGKLGVKVSVIARMSYCISFRCSRESFM